MLAIYAEDNMLHDPEQYISRGIPVPARESPERVTELLAALRDLGQPVTAPRAWGLDPILAVHDPGYVAFLQTAHARWTERGGPAGCG